MAAALGGPHAASLTRWGRGESGEVSWRGRGLFLSPEEEPGVASWRRGEEVKVTKCGGEYRRGESLGGGERKKTQGGQAVT